MYKPKFNYSHELVNLLCEIQQISHIVAGREVEQSWENRTKSEARWKAVADTLRMENITTSWEEVREFLEKPEGVASGELRRLAVNYAEALDYVDNLVKYGGGELNLGDIKELNRLSLQKIPKADWHCGKFREIQNWVVDSVKEEIVFTPASPEEVPELLDSLILWLKSGEAQALHPAVRAGIAHHRFMFIHPFVYANERVACLISRYILQHAGFFVRGLVGLTDYYAENMSAYYEHLTASLDDSRTRERDLAPWLVYFCRGLLASFRQAEEKSRQAVLKPRPKVSQVSVSEGEPLKKEPALSPALRREELNERQRRILQLGEKYTVFHRRDIIAELEIAGRYHPKTISRDLKELVDLGFLKQAGERKGIRYSLAKRN